MFRAVGSPASAVEVTLTASQKVFVGVANISATAAPLNFLTSKSTEQPTLLREIQGPGHFTLGNSGIPTIVNLDSQPWSFKRSHVLALSTPEFTSSDLTNYNSVQVLSPGAKAILTSANGAFRVDIGHNDEFVVEAKNLLGFTGVPGQVVYRESRLDALQTMTSASLQAVWNTIKFSSIFATRVGKNIYYGARSAFETIAKLFKPKPTLPAEKAKQLLEADSPEVIDIIKPTNSSASTQQIAQTTQISEISKETPRFQLPEALKNIKVVSNIRRKLFLWTHPPKLVFKGPCSVLIQ